MNRLAAVLLFFCATGCPAVQVVLPAPLDDDDASTSSDDDDATTPTPSTALSIEAAGEAAVLAEYDGTTILAWTTLAPGEAVTLDELAAGWYLVRWESDGLTNAVDVEVCVEMTTTVTVPATPGATVSCAL